MNIVDRSFLELLQPLSYVQGAPIGLLIVEKLAVQVLGNIEYVLRLFPLLCGIASLFLFYNVAVYFLDTKAILLALSIFAISDRLIYYSSEVKQYSSDVAIALLLYSMLLYVRSRTLTSICIVFLGIIGAIAIWFSHPAIFILAGGGMSLALFCLNDKQWLRISRLLVIYSIWVLSFVISYSISLHSLTRNKMLLNYWNSSFLPFPPKSVSDIQSFVNTLFEIFYDPVGLFLPGVAALAFLIGCISMFSGRKRYFFMLIFPIFFTLLASGLHKYPFTERFLLFSVPIFLLFVAEGAEVVRSKTLNSFPVIGIIPIGLLTFHPLLYAGKHLLKPRVYEEIKPVISYIKKHWQSGDLVYLYYASAPAFQYYSESYNFKKNNYVIGVYSGHKGDWDTFKKDLDKLIGNQRAWILFSHLHHWTDICEGYFFLYYLNTIGTELDSFKASGAAVYLYDLHKQEGPTKD